MQYISEVEVEPFMHLKVFWGWSDGTTGRAFAFHAADLGSIPRISYGSLRTARSNS